MNIENLIDAAKEKSGQSLKDFAKELRKSPARISEWRSGNQKPDANEIAFFARKAQLKVLETLAEIEMSLHPEFANIWQEAVSEIRQNQG